MHIFCRTERAVLLLGISDEQGIKHFPCDQDSDLPGILFTPRPQEAINVQLMDLARSCANAGQLTDIDIIQEYSDRTELDGEEITVYLGTAKAPVSAITSFHLTLPDLVRRTPQGRSRVVLIKSMQVFAGALTEQTKAVDFAEAIKHFDK